MAIKTFEDFYLHMLKDAYWADRHAFKMLKTMSRKADDAKLTKLLEGAVDGAEAFHERTQGMFEHLDKAARGATCEAMQGIIAEAKDHVEEIDEPRVLDAAMVVSAQKIVNYGIVGYGTLASMANELGMKPVAKLASENMKAYEGIDKALNKIAESRINDIAKAA